MAVVATVQAAEIQADATFNSAVIAAIIGGIGIGLGVIASWYTALHLQKMARIKEIRSVVYLELMDSQAEMVTALTSLMLEPMEKWTNIQRLLFRFTEKLEKVGFICETETKVEIAKSFKYIVQAVMEIDELVVPIRKLRNEGKEYQAKYDQLVTFFNVDIEQLKTLKSQDPNNSKIGDLVISLTSQQEKSETLSEELNKVKSKLETEQIETQKKINYVMDTLKINFLPIMHLLRNELGLKTNVELDKAMHKRPEINP